MRQRFFMCMLCLPIALCAQRQAEGNCTFKIAKLKYGGGGDWYANPSSIPNLLRYVRSHTRINVCLDEDVVEPGSSQIFQYPLVYLTGHGNMEFKEDEAANLRKYLLAGGFLLMDDNYGLQQYARREIKKIFPEHSLVALPPNHPIFKQHYTFTGGLPKIHLHDGKPAQAMAIVIENRVVLLLTYEADLGDGWEDPAVHNDPETLRTQALQMGVNILQYALGQ